MINWIKSIFNKPVPVPVKPETVVPVVKQKPKTIRTATKKDK